MANKPYTNQGLQLNDKLCDNELDGVDSGPVVASISEVHRQESGIFEGSSDFSDISNYFSDDNFDYSDDSDDDEDEDTGLWEEFQRSTFWSPTCAIKASRCPLQDTIEEEIPMVKLTSPCKKVSFKPAHQLVTVHHMITWDYAYRACRRGPWEQMAQDRARFKHRIEELAPVLEPCLKKLSKRIPQQIR